MMSTMRRGAFRMFGTLMPETAAGWFERTVLKPRPVSLPDVRAPLARATRTRMPYGSGWVSVTHWGEGPTVLLLHGWGGAAASLKAYVDPLVDAGYRVVAFDAPAHGESNGVRTNLLECSGAAIQVGNLFGPLHAVVAHSFGGPISGVAARHGLRFERLVLLGPPQSVHDLTLDIGDYIGLPRRVGELMAARVAARLDFHWQDMTTDSLVAEFDGEVLVIHDRDDRIVPFSHGKAVAEAASRGSLHPTEGLGHRGILVDPGVIDRVVNFVKEPLTADIR